MTKLVRATPSTAQIVRAIPKGSVQDKNSISFRKQDVWFPLDQELLGHLVQTLASVKETGRYGRQQLRRQKTKQNKDFVYIWIACTFVVAVLPIRTLGAFKAARGHTVDDALPGARLTVLTAVGERDLEDAEQPEYSPHGSNHIPQFCGVSA